MPNLSALSPLTTKATSLSNLILVTPNSNQGYQPQNEPNPDGSPSLALEQPALLFHYEGEQTAVLESDITDHYVEDNSAVADQIALKPEMITTHGFIGELNDILPAGLSLIKTIADKLTTVTAFVPGLTLSALIAQQQALFLYQVAQSAANSAIALWNFATGTDSQNKQQQMFQQFYGYWRTRTQFTVQTPWAIFQNMAIKSLRAIQDAETNVITGFEVTFKKIRTAQTINSADATAQLQGRAAAQAAAAVNQGTTSGAQSTLSFASALSGMGV